MQYYSTFVTDEDSLLLQHVSSNVNTIFTEGALSNVSEESNLNIFCVDYVFVLMQIDSCISYNLFLTHLSGVHHSLCKSC